MNAIDTLRQRLVEAAADPELRRLGPGLAARVRVTDRTQAFDIVLRDGIADIEDTDGAADITLAADPGAWARLLAAPPPPTYHAFTALQLANHAFTLDGDEEAIARARPTLERLFELCVEAERPSHWVWPRDVTAIAGRYAVVEALGSTFEIYYESAGSDDCVGAPVVFLHTAGADSRQFQGQLADLDLAARHRLIAFDLPFHGRSMPPLDWDGGAYRLDGAHYQAWCAAFIETVIGEPVILAGCSMGAAVALTLAAERPDLVQGVVAIEPPFRATGRRNDQQHHVAVHGALHNASFVRGLMSPFSPAEHRRRASWIYSQGAPGIYPGDLAFYSEEFDGAHVAARIDTERTPVYLLCGAYDYSASPEHGRQLQSLMPDAELREMPTLGHFPMSEDPDAFRPFLADALAALSA